MKLHEAKLLLNDPTFSIDSITYQELEMDSDYVDVHEDISYSKDNVDLHSHAFLKFYFVKVVLYNIWSAIPVISWLRIPCVYSSRCQPLPPLSGTAFRALPQNCDVGQQ